MKATTDTRVSRRTVLRATAAAAGTTAAGATAGAGALSGTAAAQDGGLAEWFSNVGNYDGVADRTGESEVTVEVGAEANGGQFGFGPAAVRVDPGTTVVWEWVGGTHNVVASDGSYESEMTSESGHTFSRTFDSEGVSKYFCRPHKTMGMKGAVVVGDADVGSAAGGESGGGQASAGDAAPSADGGTGADALSMVELGVLAFAGVLSAGLLSPLAKKALESDPGRE